MSTTQEHEGEEPASKVGRSTRDLSPEDKLRLVHEAADLDDATLGTFLRREGVHEAGIKLTANVFSSGCESFDARSKPRPERTPNIHLGFSAYATLSPTDGVVITARELPS